MDYCSHMANVKCLASVLSSLDDIGLSYVWLNQYVVNERAFSVDATERIQAVFSVYYVIINTSSTSKCLIYIC
jgi:hypothetical protein